MNQNMMNQQPNFGIEDTTAIECEKCNNNIFNNAFMFRRVSKILAGTDKDALVPIQVPVCSKCNYPIQELLPKELREKRITLE